VQPVSLSAAAETLTLTGLDTLAHYQAILQSIVYSPKIDNPANFGANPTRTVTWVVDDGAASNNLSTPVTTTLIIGHEVSNDFNGDGVTDVLWRNSTNGSIETWLLNGGQMSGGGALGNVSSAWQFAATGDVSGDGTTDVLWQNPTTGEHDSWLVTNSQLTGGTGIFGPETNADLVIGTGDFSGDGIADILTSVPDVITPQSRISHFFLCRMVTFQ